MTETKNAGVKTLGIRLPDNLHAQFTLVAQLDDLSLNDANIRAIELYVKSKRSEPNFAARAKAVVDEIERKAATERQAIQALFGTDAGQGTEPPKAPSTRRKAGTA